MAYELFSQRRKLNRGWGRGPNKSGGGGGGGGDDDDDDGGGV